ncbi:hypothetical protein Lal_00028745 [Lupinus albus]|uniref:Putative tetratricopeptide-like helical domain-containing protein n=1 Tax=Lupinus albus TaxID=3870 RepID=A0A6A5NJS5_LUPAL|nr:putative tetratricopeptide-like helical domain-containing protein [Lupinus albus]KAF1884858.1 hypothetical protein Lal_00028745 [Lupinus albus]
MEKEKEEIIENWSESVEDLIAEGEYESAISLLESLISNLETLKSSDDVSQLQLASALSDLANLYSSKGFSFKSDQLRSRASLIKQTTLSNEARVVKESKEDGDVASSSKDFNFNRNLNHDDGNHGKCTEFPAGSSPRNASSDDDWEAMADREPDELLSSIPPDCLSGVSNLKLEKTKNQTPKRRGRGTFSYEKQELYSDQLLNDSVIDVEDEETQCSSEDKGDIRKSKYGTGHVLVLADFSPSTRTIQLEKIFEDFNDRGFVIRWVNDTIALAVFQTPSVALEARNSIRCPFTVRILDEEDALLSSIKARDLEPPRQRPKTSAQAAQRLIAHGMGLKLSSTTRSSSGPREYRKQEDARRERIVSRQKLRDEAWGDV